jgi:hypothetical protein
MNLIKEVRHSRGIYKFRETYSKPKPSFKPKESLTLLLITPFIGAKTQTNFQQYRISLLFDQKEKSSEHKKPRNKLVHLHKPINISF